MSAEIGSLWEVLAQQAIGVLVSAALPGAARIAEVDLQPRADAQVRVLRHFCPLIPGQGLPNLLGQAGDGARDSVADRFCTMTGERGSVLDPRGIGVGCHARQMQQDREPCRSLYQSADRRTAETEDEITLPVNRAPPDRPPQRGAC